ncbi:hypothetical protein SDC9_163511 [bioreactor metagenome]|uniref:Uncharacterized protein n=1 Tax=bioreactor metagenome TaxID=1076179 RepID=A0A645FW00_9ZZZZ
MNTRAFAIIALAPIITTVSSCVLNDRIIGILNRINIIAVDMQKAKPHFKAVFVASSTRW